MNKRRIDVVDGGENAAKDCSRDRDEGDDDDDDDEKMRRRRDNSDDGDDDDAGDERFVRVRR
jgi:hypothetical protein